MKSGARRLQRSRKAVRKYLARAARFVARQGLKHHVVSLLDVGSAIPRPVERDEQAVAVAYGKCLLVVVQQIIRCPVRGIRGNGPGLGCARPYFLAAVST